MTPRPPGPEGRGRGGRQHRRAGDAAAARTGVWGRLGPQNGFHAAADVRGNFARAALDGQLEHVGAG